MRETEIEWRRRLNTVEAQRILLRVIRGQDDVRMENYRLRVHGEVHARLGERTHFDHRHPFVFDTYEQLLQLLGGPLCGDGILSTAPIEPLSLVKMTTCFHPIYRYDDACTLRENNQFPRLFVCKSSVELNESYTGQLSDASEPVSPPPHDLVVEYQARRSAECDNDDKHDSAESGVRDMGENHTPNVNAPACLFDVSAVRADLARFEAFELDRSDNNAGLKYIRKLYFFTPNGVRVALYSILDEFGTVRYELAVERELVDADRDRWNRDNNDDDGYPVERCLKQCSEVISTVSRLLEHNECPSINLMTGWSNDNNPSYAILRSIPWRVSSRLHARIYENAFVRLLEGLAGRGTRDRSARRYLMKLKLDGVRLFGVYDGASRLHLSDGSEIDLIAEFPAGTDLNAFLSTDYVYQLERVCDAYYFFTDVVAVRNRYAANIQPPLHGYASAVQKYRRQPGQEWPYCLIGTVFAENEWLVAELAEAKRRVCASCVGGLDREDEDAHGGGGGCGGGGVGGNGANGVYDSSGCGDNSGGSDVSNGGGGGGGGSGGSVADGGGCINGGNGVGVNGACGGGAGSSNVGGCGADAVAKSNGTTENAGFLSVPVNESIRLLDSLNREMALAYQQNKATLQQSHHQHRHYPPNQLNGRDDRRSNQHRQPVRLHRGGDDDDDDDNDGNDDFNQETPSPRNRQQNPRRLRVNRYRSIDLLLENARIAARHQFMIAHRELLRLFRDDPAMQMALVDRCQRKFVAADFQRLMRDKLDDDTADNAIDDNACDADSMEHTIDLIEQCRLHDSSIYKQVDGFLLYRPPPKATPSLRRKARVIDTSVSIDSTIPVNGAFHANTTTTTNTTTADSSFFKFAGNPVTTTNGGKKYDGGMSGNGRGMAANIVTAATTAKKRTETTTAATTAATATTTTTTTMKRTVTGVVGGDGSKMVREDRVDCLFANTVEPVRLFYQAYKLKAFQTVELMYAEGNGNNEQPPLQRGQSSSSSSAMEQKLTDHVLAEPPTKVTARTTTTTTEATTPTRWLKTDDFYRRFYFQHLHGDEWLRFDGVTVRVYVPSKFLPLRPATVYELLCETDEIFYLVHKRPDKPLPDNDYKVNAIVFARNTLDELVEPIVAAKMTPGAGERPTNRKRALSDDSEDENNDHRLTEDDDVDFEQDERLLCDRFDRLDATLVDDNIDTSDDDDIGDEDY